MPDGILSDNSSCIRAIPSGNYGGWKATSVGANNASAQSLLKQDYKEECDLKEACGMAVKVLSKTMDSTKLSSEKSELDYVSIEDRWC